MIRRFDVRLESALAKMIEHIAGKRNYVEDIIFEPERARWYYEIENIKREIASIANSDFLAIVYELQNVFEKCKKKIEQSSLSIEEKDYLLFAMSKKEAEFAFTKRLQEIKKNYAD